MSKKVSIKSAVFEHFTITADKKYYMCQCITDDDDDDKICNAKISSFTSTTEKNAPTRASNLKRHLQRLHPKIYEAVLEKDKVQDMPSSSNLSANVQVQAKVTKFFPTDKVTITMTKDCFKKHIIDMVVKDSVPLSLFSKPAFLGLNGEMARKVGVSLDRDSIRRMVIQEAAIKKEELKNALRGRFMFLKMDACTRHRVNYFAINVRFVDNNNQMVTQTLGVKDTEAHHTSDFLQKLVERVLNEFEIKNEQILCIVTDNASNMVSLIEKMNEVNAESQSLTQEDLISVSDFCPQAGESEDLEHSIEMLDDMIEEASKLFLIQHMRCAVHTLQLAIRDGLKNYHAVTLISKLRQVATVARTPKIDAILKKHAGKGAILDQITRWGSTYMMIKRLLDLKPFLDDIDNPNVSLTDSQWTQVAELERLLSHPFIATKKLQSEDLTPGAFMMEWKSLMYRLSQNGGLIAVGIADSMRKREGVLLENKILLAAIYVDPMSRVLLTREQLDVGKEALFDVAVRIKRLQVPETPELQDDEGGSSPHSTPTHSSESNDEGLNLDFEAYLDKLEHSKSKRRRMNIQEDSTDLKLRKFKQDFVSSLKDIEKFDRSSKLTIEKVIPYYPEIVRDVAMIVTAMPPTQVSVERLFSALKIIKSDLRASLKEDIAEAILFLRISSL